MYILWNPDYTETLPRVYIGYSGNVANRITSHVNDPDRRFWQQAITFTGGLDEAQAHWVEASLVELAEEAKRCTRGGDNTPAKPILSRAAEINAENFLANVRDCLSAIGVLFFEKPSLASQGREPSSLAPDSSPSAQGNGRNLGPEAAEFSLNRKDGVDAHCRDGNDGREVVVLADSRASKVESDWLRNNPGHIVYRLRQDLQRQGVLVDDGETLRFSRDYTFTNASAAAGVCLGRTSNGLREWKNSRGRTLGDSRNATEHR